jgi:D-amino-acid dehydrogenase
MRCLVIGGGIIGLGSAYYLSHAGHEVTVIDQTDMTDGCSYGNAGYVCPSHFVPLATPGIVTQGIKWMFNSRSPFYIEPRLDSGLIDWGLKFVKSATTAKVAAAAIPLRDIAVFSQHLYENDWHKNDGLHFSYERKGLLEIFQSAANADHAHHVVETAKALGLETELIDYAALKALEPGTELNALGAIFFKCDGHLSPPQLMKSLKAYLQRKQVKFVTGRQVDRFEKSQNRITGIFAGDEKFTADEVIIANGSWSRELAAKLNLQIPLVGGRGYSITYENSPFQLNFPSVLMEARVATTPLGNDSMRFGGTMEITSKSRPARMKRVEGILNAVKRYYPQFNLPMPEPSKVWFGYRPCSADGLPYIGRAKGLENCIIATGHSMLGLSLGAGTGKLVSELADRKQTSISLAAFEPSRFD